MHAILPSIDGVRPGMGLLDVDGAVVAFTISQSGIVAAGFALD